MRPTGGYRDLMARLAAVPAALAAEQAEIQQWYEEQLSKSEAALAAARRSVADAERALEEAEATLEWTDDQAHRLWRMLHSRLGRLGPTPEPVDAVEADDDAVHHIHAAAEAVAEAVSTRRPAGRRSPLAVLVGLVAVVATVALALWLTTR